MLRRSFLDKLVETTERVLQETRVKNEAKNFRKWNQLGTPHPDFNEVGRDYERQRIDNDSIRPASYTPSPTPVPTPELPYPSLPRPEVPALTQLAEGFAPRFDPFAQTDEGRPIGLTPGAGIPMLGGPTPLAGVGPQPGVRQAQSFGAAIGTQPNEANTLLRLRDILQRDRTSPAEFIANPSSFRTPSALRDVSSLQYANQLARQGRIPPQAITPPGVMSGITPDAMQQVLQEDRDAGIRIPTGPLGLERTLNRNQASVARKNQDLSQVVIDADRGLMRAAEPYTRPFGEGVIGGLASASVLPAQPVRSLERLGVPGVGNIPDPGEAFAAASPIGGTIGAEGLNPANLVPIPLFDPAIGRLLGLAGKAGLRVSKPVLRGIMERASRLAATSTDPVVKESAQRLAGDAAETLGDAPARLVDEPAAAPLPEAVDAPTLPRTVDEAAPPPSKQVVVDGETYVPARTEPVSTAPEAAPNPRVQRRVELANAARAAQATERGALFHGTAMPFEDFGEEFLDGTALFGPGVYLTDDADIAARYATRKAGGDTVQLVRPREGVRLINLEQPLPPDVVSAIGARARGVDFDVEAGAEAAEAAGRGAKGTDVYRSFRDGLAEESGRLSVFDAAESMDGLNRTLKDLGYDGFTHTGGIRGGPPHNVTVLFDTADAQVVRGVQPPARASIAPENVVRTVDELAQDVVRPRETGTTRLRIDGEEVVPNEGATARTVANEPAPTSSAQPVTPEAPAKTVTHNLPATAGTDEVQRHVIASLKSIDETLKKTTLPSGYRARLRETRAKLSKMAKNHKGCL